MHSRKKRDRVPTEEEKKSEKERLQRISKLHQKVFEAYKAKQYDEEALELTKKSMLISPDVYSFFNFRKQQLTSLVTEENSTEIYKRELDLLMKIVKESPKSYTLWYHRQWVLERCKDNPELLAKELSLCDYMLSKDPRNFHCWNYRTWVVKLSPDFSPNEEMEFTKTMINRDFSNFSAWHYRSKLVKQLYPTCLPADFLASELLTLKNGYFTCPNDQSIWNYHRWLLQQTVPITITGITPRKYSAPPPECFLIAFSHKISSPSAEDIGVSHGWEPLQGTWSPCTPSTYSYTWRFSPSAPVTGGLELRLNANNTTLSDIDGFKSLTSLQYKYREEGAEWVLQVEGQEDTELLERELAGVQELLEIEDEEVVQALLRKAQLLESLAQVSPNNARFAEIVTSYRELLKHDPQHAALYQESLSAFSALLTGTAATNGIQSEKLLARVLGI